MTVPATGRVRLKQEVLDEIASLIGAPPRSLLRGSTVPKQVFCDVIRAFALQIDEDGSMPQLGESIAHHAGLAWPVTNDSRQTDSGGGSTVTIDGLETLLASCRLLVRRGRGGLSG